MAAMQLASTGDPGRQARRLVLVGFAVCTAWFTGVFPPFVNPNELSRLDLVYAAVEQGTFRIDAAIPVLGDHEDKAAANGHFYSNKPPGLALAAIPIYRLLRVFVSPPRSGSALLLVYVLPLLTVSLATVLALRRCGERFAQASPPGGALVLLALAFGTPLLFYSRTFFAHAWSASLLFLGWDILRSAEERPNRARASTWLVFGGFLAGWAFLSEYTVAPILLCLLLRAAAGRAWKRAFLFAAGAAVPVLVLLAYQAVCFGNPLTPSYAREAYPAYSALARQRFFGFGMPSGAALWGLLLHPARGILTFSPFLAWAGAGFVRWWKSREDRADCLFTLTSVTATILFLASYPNWHGGWSLGSRYLLPIFPFAALAASRALATPLSRGLFLAATVYSVASHFLLAATWPNFPIWMPFPAATGSSWFLARGWVAAHLGPPSRALDAMSVLLALGVTAAATVRAASAARPLRPSAALAALIGFAPLAFLLARPPELTFTARIWRAAVFGKFSGRDPAREELRRVAESAETEGERRLAGMAWRTYGPDSSGAPPSSPAVP